MKIILLKDFRGLGRKWDIKDVAEGYARNFLIANGVAVAMTPKVLARRDAYLADKKRQTQQEQEQAEKLSGEVLEFKLKTGERGAIFGSVHADEIKKELTARGYSIKEVVLPRPIKATGSHAINVKWDGGLESTIIVQIVAVDNF